METFSVIMIVGLVILFFISFAFFISRMLVSTSKRSETDNLEEKLEMIIEQNDRIISLLEEKR